MLCCILFIVTGFSKVKILFIALSTRHRNGNTVIHYIPHCQMHVDYMPLLDQFSTIVYLHIIKVIMWHCLLLYLLYKGDEVEKHNSNRCLMTSLTTTCHNGMGTKIANYIHDYNNFLCMHT